MIKEQCPDCYAGEKWIRNGPSGAQETCKHSWHSEAVTSNLQFEPEIMRLMEFYDCNSYRDLVLTQASHIARLQERLPAGPGMRPSRPREG